MKAHKLRPKKNRLVPDPEPAEEAAEPKYTRAEQWRLTPQILKDMRPIIRRGNLEEFKLALLDYGLVEGSKRYDEAVAAWPLLQSELRSVRRRG